MNYKKHLTTIYTVYNQNGFNAALYDCFGATLDSKSKIRRMVQNYPKTYPSTIRIIDQSFECARVYIEIVSIDEIIASFQNNTKAEQ